jgi:hypothetical protein
VKLGFSFDREPGKPNRALVIKEAIMAEKSTAEVMQILGNDVDRCKAELDRTIDAGEKEPNGDVICDYEYHARQLIRAVFAYMEAVTFSVKIKAAHHLLNSKLGLAEGERAFAGETDYKLADKGTVIEQPAHIRTADNIRFAIALADKAYGVGKKFDPSIGWWPKLKSSIKVRDRLTHPKLPDDVNVSGDELINLIEAHQGFSEHMLSYKVPTNGEKLRTKAKRKARARIKKS